MIQHLLHRYGSAVRQLIDAIEAKPDLVKPLEHAPAYLRAEIHFAATHEQVLHLEDVMLHRTRLTYEVADAGRAALDEIAQIVAEVLGWDEAKIAHEKASYIARCEATDAAALTTSDADAEEARLAAVDIAPLQPLEVAEHN